MMSRQFYDSAAARSRSDVVKTSHGLMLYRIEMLGGRGEVATVEYHVSNRNSHERWVFDNQTDADWCFYEALKGMRVAGRA
jgi:hypothetical protein